MDAAWAVVVGAAIAAAGTIAGAPLASAFTDRRQRRAKRHDELASAIAECLESLLGRLQAEAIGSQDSAARDRVIVAASRLGLLIEKGDDAVVRTVTAANAAMKLPAHRNWAFAQAAYALPAWYRGDLPIDAVDQIARSIGEKRSAVPDARGSEAPEAPFPNERTDTPD
ncbi:hypothetical protein [Agromyces sp. ZXT2-6]|uniref:hypothetical protein n=1 Tax=Agromyces sp. ZXT2-6 TaxID=3461153 RepID=UPI004054A6B3